MFAHLLYIGTVQHCSNLPRGPSSGAKISAQVIWGKNMKKEEKKGKMQEKKEERGKRKGKRGKMQEKKEERGEVEG